jgi:hypothetical protein
VVDALELHLVASRPSACRLQGSLAG